MSRGAHVAACGRAPSFSLALARSFASFAASADARALSASSFTCRRDGECMALSSGRAQHASPGPIPTFCSDSLAFSAAFSRAWARLTPISSANFLDCSAEHPAHATIRSQTHAHLHETRTLCIVHMHTNTGGWGAGRKASTCRLRPLRRLVALHG